MSLSILPDESIVVRLSTHTVHIDARGQGIHLREPSESAEEGGKVMASFPLEAADRVRMGQTRDGTLHLYLDLHTGDTLHLGEVPSSEAAMMASQVISEVTQCKVQLQIPAKLPAPEPKPEPAPFWPDRKKRAEPIDKTPPRRPGANKPVETERAKIDPLEQATRRIDLDNEPRPKLAKESASGDVEGATIAAAPAPVEVDRVMTADEAPTSPPGPAMPPLHLQGGPIPKISPEKDNHSTEPSMQIELGAQPKAPATDHLAGPENGVSGGVSGPEPQVKAPQVAGLPDQAPPARLEVPAWAEAAYHAQSSDEEASLPLVIPASPSLDEDTDTGLDQDAVSTIADRPLSDFPELMKRRSEKMRAAQALEPQVQTPTDGSFADEADDPEETLVPKERPPEERPERITLRDRTPSEIRALAKAEAEAEEPESTLKEQPRVGLSNTPQPASEDSTDPEDAAVSTGTPPEDSFNSGEPIFQQLLLESQLASAMTPEELLDKVGAIGSHTGALDASEMDEEEALSATEVKAPFDPLQQLAAGAVPVITEEPHTTDLNVQRRSKTEALLELLRFAAEQIPEAPEDPIHLEGPSRPFEPGSDPEDAAGPTGNSGVRHLG